MIKVLLADDHAVVTDGLRSVLQNIKDIQVISTALNGREVINSVKKEPPEVILMDINMPEMNGIETTKYLTANFPDIKVLILSMYNDAPHINEALNNGAKGYLLKNTGKEELEKAIKVVYNNKNYYSNDVTNALIKSHLDNQKTSETNSHSKSETVKNVNLSDREIEIIKLICEEKTMVEIADELSLSEHTVKTHRKNVLRKLDAKNTAGLVKYAYQHGIIKK